MIGRRHFIALLGGAATAWPVAARGQQLTRPARIGFLGSTTMASQGAWVAAFVQRMREIGWIEGRNLNIEVRWAEGRPERFAEIAAELVGLTRRSGGVVCRQLDDLDAIFKFDTCDDLRQLFCAF
jgi:putative ABC transport system substrate-binding protein